MSTKRISRQELREDPLVSTYERAQHFVAQHWRVVVAVLGLIVIAVVAVTVLIRSREATQNQAAMLLLKTQRYAKGQDYVAAIEQADRILADYPGTGAARRAAIVKAEALTATGDLPAARQAFEDARSRVGGDPILRTAADRGLAVTLENMGDFGAAATLYERLGNEAIPEGGRIFDLRSAARCYASIGSLEPAIKLLDEVVSRYESSDDRVYRDQVHLAKVARAEYQYASEHGTVPNLLGGSAQGAGESAPETPAPATEAGEGEASPGEPSESPPAGATTP